MFYGFDKASVMKGILAELVFANTWGGIPTYVRSDKSTVVYRVESPNTAANGKRLNGFLESNREELDRNNWLSIGYIDGG